MIERISQSFIKNFREFTAREGCGNIIREMYVNGRLLKDPEAKPGPMELGSYFEFVLTGALPKSGEVPQALYTLTGMKKEASKRTEEDMLTEYRRATEDARRVSGIWKEMGLEVVKAGWTVTKGRFVGTLDVLMKCTRAMKLNGVELEEGEHIVLDTKYSGLLSETTPRTNKHGWKWSNVQKEYHGTQAIQYHYISGGLKFFFWVVASGKDNDSIGVFYVPVDQHQLDRHLWDANVYFDTLKSLVENELLEPFPEYTKCGKCPLRKECPDRALFPSVEIVDLTIL